MSRNNKFLELGAPIRSYKKTVPFAITGKRLHPASKTPMSFVLTSSQEPKEGEDILELYSEEEIIHFRRANVTLFTQGYIQEAGPEEQKDPETDPNFMTEERLADIIATKNQFSLNKKIKDITSLAVIQQIIEAFEEKGMSRTIRTVLEDKMKELE